MAEDQTTADITEMMRRMQALFTPTGTVAPGLEQMLVLQQEMARQTQTFARHWFERRQEAAETGLAALQTLGATRGSDPAAALGAITDWQRGSFRRVNADLQEWVALCTLIPRIATVKGEADRDDTPTSGTTRPKKAGTTGARSRAATSPASQHATPV